MEMAKVTSKGQITIPVSIRRRLKINEGDNLLFIDRPEGVVMVNPDMLPGTPAEGKQELIIQRPETSPEIGNDKTGDAPQPAPSIPVGSDEQAGPKDHGSEKSVPVEDVPAPAAAQPVIEPEKPGKQLQGLDLNELLNEIRSIGSRE